MRTCIAMLWMLAMLVPAASAQTSKTKAKSKPVASKTAKPKVVATPKVQTAMGIPADAFYFKDNNNHDAKISSVYKAIVVEGDGNKISIAEGNSQLFVKGKNNDINMISADYIEITGNGNFVSWETTRNPAGKPVIVDKGGYNNVGKRSSGASKTDD